MKRRVLWLAVAEARGHLMRAHRARQLLAPGVQVDIKTTTAAGVAFLRALGTPSSILGRGYALAFDARQNLTRGATNRRLLRYLADPRDALHDVRQLHKLARHYDLIVDDSFHPAAFLAPALSSSRRLPIVHVYGASLYRAFAEFHEAHAPAPLSRLYEHAVEAVCRSSFARIEHTLEGPYGRTASPDVFRLPPLLDRPSSTPHETRRSLGVRRRLIVAYLNPHFRDVRIAEAIEHAASGATLWAVGEGFASRPGWRAYDPRLQEKTAAADVVLSAPGMATSAAALMHGVPFVGLLSAQPEQHHNFSALARLGSAWAVDVGEGVDRAALRNAVDAAARINRDLTKSNDAVVASRDAWRDIVHYLLDVALDAGHAWEPTWKHQPLRWSSRPTI